MMTDCLIIGGGVNGLLSALQLHDAGLQVTVIEQSTLGQESSWAGGGILSPLYPWRSPAPITALARWGQTHYPEFADELFQRTGIDPEYVRNGLLVLDGDEYLQARAWADFEHIPLEKLEQAALRDCEPELEGYNEALWFPDIAQIRNPRLLKALKQALILANVPLLEHQTVHSLKTQNGKIIGIKTHSQEWIATEQVVIAAGAWSANLLYTLNVTLPIVPVRGQMILFSTQPGLVSRIILANDRYIIPRRDGHVLVGSTLEEAGFNKTTTHSALEDLKYAAFHLVPRLTDYTVQKHWAGVRPGTPQGIPYIGKHPSIEGLFLNTGHFRNGIVLGLASARLLTDLMLGREPILDPTHFAPPL